MEVAKLHICLITSLDKILFPFIKIHYAFLAIFSGPISCNVYLAAHHNQ